MKRLILSALFISMAMLAFGQAATDTAKSAADTSKNDGSFSIHIGRGDHGSDSSHHYKTHYPKGFIGPTFARFDLGLATLVDHGSFTLQHQNKFLSYAQWKTSNVGFDVFQMGLKFSPNFKLYASAGFNWTLIRLHDNITILRDQPILTYRQDSIQYSKNRFSSSYLRVPLSFAFQTNEDSRGNRWHLIVGPEGDFLLEGMVKQISKEFGKQKFYNPYHFTEFEYGGFARVGYGDFGIFAKYYANDMFQDSPDQAGLKNFSFGFTLGF
jgi:hypothetical protein